MKININIKILIISIVIALILIIIGVINISKETIEIEESLDMEQDINSMRLVKDYTTYYTLDQICREIITNIYNGIYNNVINTSELSMFENTNRDVLLENLKNVNKILHENEYNLETSRLLYEVYEKEENEYNCVLDILGDMHYVLIYLDDKNMTYEIRNIKFSEVQ